MKPFEALTPKEKRQICNGCGGKGGWIKPPHQAFFEASCDHHDYGYWKGCTEAARLNCDKSFYQAMKQDCESLPWYQWIRYRPWCWIYYRAVRCFGKKYFNYGNENRDPGQVMQ